MNELAIRKSIDEVEVLRSHALARYADAFDALQEAASLVPGGAPALGEKLVSELTGYRSYADSGVERRQKFLELIRQETDRVVWKHLIDAHGFDRLMDRKARDEFRAALESDPPIVSAETAYNTLAGLISDADKIFRRGISEAFSKLDRRFRSHDGFKIGSRVVLDNAISAYGNWNHYRRIDDVILDIERTFYTLDGKSQPERYAGIVGQISEATRGRLERVAAYVENDYFRVRCFKNGNVHLWFRRDDLLEKVNKLLAEHYGEVLGAASDVAETDHFSNPKTSIAKNFAFFPTPLDVCQRLVAESQVKYHERPRVLEPSAGEGAIAIAIREANSKAKITCVEVHPERSSLLDARGFTTRHADFLSLTEQHLGTFDFVLMNPPFDGQRDIDHVVHASRFLAGGGKLFAVMSAGVEFREDKKSVAFRKLVERMHGEITDLPQGSFSESGTMVNTCIVTLKN